MARDDDYTPEERQLLNVDVSKVPDAIVIAKQAHKYFVEPEHIERFEKALDEVRKELLSQPKRPRP